MILYLFGRYFDPIWILFWYYFDIILISIFDGPGRRRDYCFITAFNAKYRHNNAKRGYHVLTFFLSFFMILIYFDLSWSIFDIILIYFDLSWSILIYVDLFWSILIYFELFWSILIYLDLFWSMLIYFDLFWSILIYFDLF